MAINDEILNQLMKGYEKPEDLLGKDGLFMEPKKALVERALAEELTHHLGYEKGGKPSRMTATPATGTVRKKSTNNGQSVKLYFCFRIPMG
jgi:transposase-like protein